MTDLALDPNELDTLDECAATGARFFDKTKPDWFHRIDVPKLRMDHICNCIVGQLWGSFRLGIDRLWPDAGDAWIHAEQHGLMISDRITDALYSDKTVTVAQIYGVQARYYAHLDMAWRREIAARLTVATPLTQE